MTFCDINIFGYKKDKERELIAVLLKETQYVLEKSMESNICLQSIKRKINILKYDTKSINVELKCV